MKPILKSYLIEINLGTTQPGNGSNINFQDYPQLRDIYITGIECFYAPQVAISPAGKAVVTDLTGITLTLKDKYNMDMVYQYPTYDLNPALVGGFYRDFLPFELQLTKSYINITDNTNLAANQSVIFNVFYIQSKDFPKYAKQYIK